LINKNENYDEDLLYNHSGCLEVAGIRLETENNTVKKKLNEKLKRLEKYKHDFSIPTYIIVVEFGKPYARFYGLSI